MKRRYEATHKEETDVKTDGKSESQTMKLEREIDRLTDERDSWRKRAEAEGSLFDLKRDSVKNIAATIAGNVSLSRLISLQKAIAEEIARLKAEQKHAG
jgi:hypothetical protein